MWNDYHLALWPQGGGRRTSAERRSEMRAVTGSGG